MRYSVFKTILLLFLFVVLVMMIDRYFFDRKANNFGTTVIQRPAAYLFSKLESARWQSRFFLQGFIKFKDVELENESLTRENLGLLSRLADYEDLKSENEFLRKAMNISLRFNNDIVYANIYQFQLGLNGYDVLINKGVDDGVTEGDVVITEEGVLVGRVESAHDTFSRLLVVSDTDFGVTAKVLSSDTAGIAKGALNRGMYFDLIIQRDSIKEGDVVVSSGMDLIPSSLLVGTVSHVETKDTDLFKKVRIKPAMGEIKIGRVLVISKN